MSTVVATAVLIANELWRIWQIRALPLLTQREIAEDERAHTVGASADTLTALACEGIQPIVDRNLLALPNWFPSIDMRTFAHGIGIAGVIEIAAWRQQDCALIPIQFA